MPPSTDQSADRDAPREEEDTGLKWPRSWRSLYVFVAVVVAAWVAILYALTRKFS